MFIFSSIGKQICQDSLARHVLVLNLLLKFEITCMFQSREHYWGYSLSNFPAEALLVAKIHPPKRPVTASPFRVCKPAFAEIAFHKSVHWDFDL